MVKNIKHLLFLMLLWVVWIVLLVWAGLVKAEWFTKVSLIWLAIVGLGEVLFKNCSSSLVRVGLSWFNLSLCSLQSTMRYCPGYHRHVVQVLTSKTGKILILTFLLDLLTSSILMSHGVACACSVMSQLFAAPGTVAHQAPQAKTNCMTEFPGSKYADVDHLS